MTTTIFAVCERDQRAPEEEVCSSTRRKGQVLEDARRTRAGGAGRGGQTRAGSHYKEGTRSCSPVPVIHDFAGFPPPRPPFDVTFTPPAAGKLFYSPGETPVPCYT
jgi:hypothetical protein